MKISQMSTDQAADVLVRIANPIARIMDDEEVEPLLQQLSESEKLSVIKIISSLLPKVVLLAVQRHRLDLYEIVGAFSGKNTKQVGAMNIMQTMAVLKESIDEDFLDFFRLSGGQGQKTDAE